MSDKYLPSFANHDLSEASKLLKKFNVTAAKEVEFFNQLCSLGKSTIPYKDALLATSMQDEEFVFANIAKKFEQYQVLILRTTIEGENLVPSYVRLCQEGSFIFIAEYISEQINNTMVNPEIPLPSRNALSRNGFEIPKKNLIKLNQQHFLTAYKAQNNPEKIEDEALYILPITNGEYFISTFTSLPLLCKLAITRMKIMFTTSQDLLFTIGNTIEVPLEDLKMKTESDDEVIWEEIITLIYNNFEKLKTNQRIVHHYDLLDTIIILYNAIKPKIMYLLDTEQNKQIIDIFIRNVLKKIQEITEGITEQHFFSIIKTEVDNLQLDKVLADEAMLIFKNQYTVPSDNIPSSLDLKNQDIILEINRLYIHSSIIVKIITEQFMELSKTLQEYYTNLLYKYLTKGLPPNDIVFFDEDAFEISVHQKVKEFNEVYSQILRNPVLLATLLVRKPLTATDPANNLQNMPTSRKMALFFNLRTKELLPWREIFNVHLPRLIELAYNKLKWYRRLILFFTGRYKHMYEKLTRLQHHSSMMTPNKEELKQNRSSKINNSKITPKKGQLEKYIHTTKAKR